MSKTISNFNGDKIEIWEDKCIEWCSTCGEEVEIEADFSRIQHCPICNENIIPCNLCDMDIADCEKCKTNRKSKKIKWELLKDHNIKSWSCEIGSIKFVVTECDNFQHKYNGTNYRVIATKDDLFINSILKGLKFSTFEECEKWILKKEFLKYM